MKLTKFSKKMVAYVCAIAMVVASMVYVPSTTGADVDPSTLDYTTVESGGNEIGYSIVSNTIVGSVDPWYGDGGITFQLTFAGGDVNPGADTTVKVNGVQATSGVVTLIGDGLVKLNPMQMDNDAYTHVEITAKSGSEDIYFKKGNPGGPTQEPTDPPAEKELLPALDAWNTYPADTTVKAEDEVTANVPAYTTGDNWATQLVKNGLKLTNGKWYKATVTLTSSVSRKFQMLVQSDGAQGGNWSLMNYDNNLFEAEANVAKTFTCTFQASGVVNNYLFGIMMGYVDDTSTEACTVTVTNASLIEYAEQPSTEAPTEEPSTEAPTAEPTTEEPSTEAPTQKPQDYYDAWVDTDRNLSRAGTPSHTGLEREGHLEDINDGEIGLWNNWYAITVDGAANPNGSFDIQLDKAYDAASIDQVVVYWRTADVQFVPQSGYKVQFGYKGTFYDVDTVAKADYPTEGTTGGWVDAARFVTDSDFTASRLESKGVDTVRIYVDTPVEWGAQIRELCVFAENPQDAPEQPQADAPAAITANSPDYGQIAYNVTAGEGQDAYKYNVYANDTLIGEGVNAGQDYIAYGFAPGEYSVKAVSIVEGMDPSDPVFADAVTVADPLDLFSSTKNKAPNGSITDVSSFYNDDYDLATDQCAIDGTPQAGEGNTVCARTAAGVGASVDIDLGQQYNVKDLQKILIAYTNPRTYAANTMVGISNDGVNYELAAEAQGFVPTKDGQLSVNMIDSQIAEPEGTFQYVRILLDGGVNDWGYCINQIGVIVDDGEEPSTEPTSEQPSTEEPSSEVPTGSGYDMHRLDYDTWTSLGGVFYAFTGSGNQAQVDVGYDASINKAKTTQISGGNWWTWNTQVAAVYPQYTDDVKAGKEYKIKWHIATEDGASGNKIITSDSGNPDDPSTHIDFSSGDLTLEGTLKYDENIGQAAWCIGTMWIPEGVSVIFDNPEITGDEPTSESPTVEPSTEPTSETPSVEPSTEPTSESPTVEPSTEAPTTTVEPTTQAPTQKPTQAPTVKPTDETPVPIIKIPDKVSVKKAVKKKKSAKKIKVKLKKQKGAKGYQIAVYKTKKKAKKNKKALVKKYTTKIKLTIKSKKFKKKKKLYVRARAYTLDGIVKVFGPWSKVKKTTKK